MEHKYKEFLVKEAGETEDEHYILAYAATFHREPDSYGDIIAPGAFADTLKAWQDSGNAIPLLFGHRMDDPLLNIGSVVEAGEDETGLLVKAVFDMTNERGAYSYKLVKEGRLVKLSFAYDVLDAAPVELEGGIQANELRKLNIYEVSLVPVPANQHAEVIEVKDTEPDTKCSECDTEEPNEVNAEAEEPSRVKEIAALIARIDIETYEKEVKK